MDSPGGLLKLPLPGWHPELVTSESCEWELAVLFKASLVIPVWSQAEKHWSRESHVFYFTHSYLETTPLPLPGRGNLALPQCRHLTSYLPITISLGDLALNSEVELQQIAEAALLG